MSDENKIRDAADAVKGILEAVPVYQDVAQPAAKEIGTALQTVAKTIHIALSPISALVWSYEKIADYLDKTLTEKLNKRNVPPERIVTPNPIVAVPTIEALRYVGPESSLRELYANLLAAAMDAKTAGEAHPAFVEIIRQLSPDEARLLSYMSMSWNKGVAYHPLISAQISFKFGASTAIEEILKHLSFMVKKARCVYPHLWHSYLDNLKRLGLVEISNDVISMGYPFPYGEEAKEIVLKTYKVLRGEKVLPELEDIFIYDDREYLTLTSFGAQFLNVCIQEKTVENDD